MTTLQLNRRAPCGEIDGHNCDCKCGEVASCGQPNCPHECYNNLWNMPCVYIMIGLPGCGKSTISKQIIDQAARYGHTGRIHSTDQYFIVDGEYRFNRDNLRWFHKKNQDAFKRSVRDKVHTIIVDNTNLIAKDRLVYSRYAKIAKYRVVYIVVGEFDKVAVIKYFNDNTHAVPLDTINRMAKRVQIPGDKIG